MHVSVPSTRAYLFSLSLPVPAIKASGLGGGTAYYCMYILFYVSTGNTYSYEQSPTRVLVSGGGAPGLGGGGTAHYCIHLLFCMSTGSYEHSPTAVLVSGGGAPGLGGAGAVGRPGGNKGANGVGLNGIGGDLLAQLSGGGGGSGLAGLSGSSLPLSSQLQHLLQGTGGGGRVPGSTSGDGANLHSLFGGGGGSGLIPGWVASEVLPAKDEVDPNAGFTRAASQPALAGKGAKKEPVLAVARNDKPKKRGGSGNRGGKVELKPGHK